MNAVMKVLTIIATIFMPLTFLAGVYGMNFDPDSSPWNMPELRWFWGYPVTLLGMALITVLMLLYFRRRGWIGQPDLPGLHPEETHRQHRRRRVDLQ
jgi:magnesium transporter